MLTIKYGPINSVVVGDDKRETAHAFRLLDERFAVWVEGANFTSQYELGFWDGYARFFSKTSGQFSSGLLTKVVAALLADDYDFELEGLPEPYEGHDSQAPIVLPCGMEMRDYQAAGIRNTLTWYRGIWKIATNGGKTAMASAFIHCLGPNKRVLVLVPLKVLLYQFAEELKEKLKTDQVFLIGDGHFNLPESGIVVAMYQTMSRKRSDKKLEKWLQGVDALIVDECHLSVADTFMGVIKACPANFRVGMSGTPFREEKHKRMQVRALFGSILSKVGNKELIDKGVSTKPHVVFLDVLNTKLKSDMDFQTAYESGITHNKNRNTVIASLAEGFLASGRQTVITVQHRSHMKLLQKMIPGSVMVSGYSSTARRNKIIDRLKSGEVFCVICTSIFDTGMSVDYIEALIKAGGGKSEIKTLQTIGRALRQAKDKVKDVWVVDFQDNHHVDLRRHGNARMKAIVNQDAFDTTELAAHLPVEVQRVLPVKLLNASHFDVPLLEM